MTSSHRIRRVSSISNELVTKSREGAVPKLKISF